MDQFLFNLNPNPILVYDTETHRIIKANDAFKEKYGYQSPAKVDLTIEDIRPAHEVGKLHKAIEQLNDDGLNKEESVQHKASDGTLFVVNVSSHDYPMEDTDARIVFIHDVTKQVEAEKQAQKAFEELNHHVNESPLAMVKWDEHFNLLDWSKRAQQIMGFSKEDVVGKSPLFLSFYRERDREVVKKNVEQILSGDRDKVEFDMKIYTRDGELVDLRVHGSALHDENDNLFSVLTFFEDITEQKKTELRYQRLFENANDGIFLAREGKFVECNDKICDIFGCSRDDILGKSPADFSPEFQPDGRPSDEKAAAKIEQALHDGPQVFEWKHTRLDGTPIHTEVSLNRLELAEEVYVQAIIRDLTDQKKAQEKIRKSEEMFRKLFLRAPGAIIMVDNNQNVQMVNESFEDLFGYSEDELVGENIDEIIVHPDDAPLFPGRDFEEGKFYENVTRYTKDGEPRDIMLGTIPVHLDDEPIAGFGVYIDITKQKENERKLKQSLKENQVLLEEIHHRVKNNLAIISGFLQLQAFEIEDEKTKEVLNDSQLRIQSIAIVHEMLYQSENFVDISFETYIRRLVNTMKKTLPLDYQHIDIEIDAANVSLDINQAIPSAILINELVTNSYKHAFDEEASGTIWVNLYEEEDQITIQVKDNGVGLPNDFSIEEQESIGMNLIQTLTDQLDGTLEMKNGDGGCFEVWFAKSSTSEYQKLREISEEE